MSKLKKAGIGLAVFFVVMTAIGYALDGEGSTPEPTPTVTATPLVTATPMPGLEPTPRPTMRPTPVPTPKPPAVSYVITGSASRVDVTLNNPTGGTEQFSNVAIPKTYSYSSFPEWFLYISAQNQGERGTVTVSIYVKGALFKTSTSSGAYVIASASGSK